MWGIEISRSEVSKHRLTKLETKLLAAKGWIGIKEIDLLKIKFFVGVADGTAGARASVPLFEDVGQPVVNLAVDVPLEQFETLIDDGLMMFKRWLEIKRNVYGLVPQSYKYSEMAPSQVDAKTRHAVELTAQAVKQDLNLVNLPEIRFMIESLDGSGFAYPRNICGFYWVEKKAIFIRVDLGLEKAIETTTHELMHYKKHLEHESSLCNRETALNMHVSHDAGHETECRQYEKKFNHLAESERLKIYDPKPKPACFGKHAEGLRCSVCW